MVNVGGIGTRYGSEHPLDARHPSSIGSLQSRTLGGAMRTTGATTVETGELSALPAGPILIQLRRVLITTAGGGVVYTILSTGSAGSCSDNGGEVGSGEAVQTTCANLVLRPSWIVYAAFGAILFVAIG